MTEIYSVATGFHGMVSRQSISMSRQGVFVSGQNLTESGIFLSRQNVLCRNRVGNGGEPLCRDIVI